jgi:hypothetical protein
MNRKWTLLLAALALAGCPQHVMVPQLVRSYTMDWPGGTGPEGQALSSNVIVLVANEPYLMDQCASQVRAGTEPLHGGAHLTQSGCVRIAQGNRAEIVVPDGNEQAAVTHQLEHLKGRWCHDAQNNPAPCPR